MKFCRIAVAVVASICFASAAFAQMHSHGVHGSTGMTGTMGSIGMASIAVTPEGNAVTVKSVTAQNAAPKQSLVAYTPSGGIAWTWSSESYIGLVTIADHFVLVTTGSGMTMGNMNFTTKLVALSTTTGEVAWQLQLDGIPMDLEPSATQIYALAITPGFGIYNGGMGPGNGMPSMQMKSTLSAISLSGTVLWTKSLNE
jgi:outer membrane protein assembly factor BamB